MSEVPPPTPGAAIAFDAAIQHPTGDGVEGLIATDGVAQVMLSEAELRKLTASRAKAAGLGGALTPQVIIGADNLTHVGDARQLPYRFVAYLRLRFANGRAGHGTGFMIGRRVLATAAHNLNHPDHGPVVDLAVAPGSGGRDAPFGILAAQRVWLPSAYVETRATEHDYGLIYLGEPVGDRTGWFGMIDYTAGFPIGLRSWVCGYPGDRPLGMYSDGGILSASTSSEIYYLFDTVEGMSGAPIFVNVGGVWKAIGIHHEGLPTGNSARRLSGAVYRWMAQEAARG